FSQSSPSAYLAWHRTHFHSIVAAILLSAVVALILTQLKRSEPDRRRLLSLFGPALVAAALHLLLDLCQSLGVEMLWPFSRRRFALDWLPKPDLFISALLLLALLLPKLASLVSEEIGAKSRSPRGRGAAIFAFVVLAVYVGARALLHANAV